jgi:NitT/TauT family transport system substrate-binding protein
MSIKSTAFKSAITLAAIGALLTPAAANAASAKPAAPLATAPTVRIGYFANLTHAPALIARQEKLFEKYLPGAKLEFSLFTVGTTEIEALKGGALDIAYVGPGPAVSGYVTTQGTLLNIIAGATTGGAKFVVKPSLIATEGAPTAAEISALAGKTIADPGLGGTQDIALRSYLKAKGLYSNGQPTANVTPLANADTLTLFKQGKIDGAWVPEPWATRLIQEGAAKTFVDEKNLWPQGKFATTVVVASQAFEKKFPGSVQGVLQANEDAISFLKDPANKNDAINDVQAELLAGTGKKLSDTVLAIAWPGLKYNSDPAVGSVQTNFANSVGLGQLPGAKLSDLKGIFNFKLLNTIRAKTGQGAVIIPANLK